MSEERSEPRGDHGSVRRLDDATVASVAAGEVITRPADVVVELLENALDAGASRISVAVDGDGTAQIRVRDDGGGMSRRDAELAVERHTTSKLESGESLSAVETLGFRGEALASIATVAELEVVTNDGGPRGTRVVASGGPGPDRLEPVGRGRGTTVTVRDLFAETPARRESLAAAQTEFARISDAVSRYALVRPDVAITLGHDGSEVFSTPGTGEFADAILGVYDRQVASRATTFDATRRVGSARAGDGAGLTVDGALVQPSITRARRDHVYVAVDGRPVRNAQLQRAVVDGYGDLLADGRAPIAVVSLSLPTSWADHNVHPRKRRVRLRSSDEVADAVAGAVSDALSTADQRRAADLSMDLDDTLEPLSGTESAFDDVRVLGQFRDLYLLCAFEDELLVVDQHAAHERVNYERLRAAVSGETPTAAIDPPESVSLTPGQYAAVESHRDELSKLGYDLDCFGETTVRVRSVPAPMGRAAASESVRDAVDALRHGETPEDGRDALLKDLACHPSLKAGDDLSDAEATALVDRLGSCENPYACPHGRPTVLTIGEDALVRGFGRRGTRMD
ncbi:DNA mismatch repair endonuclease MutL [Halobellus sp. Atlit-38R]|uniref:DNA mismatch repair endonuclease MutL n=1 Tax=Halobellus sp. Atlit-38R TaxID=2282131 RepID=UPI000EF293D3|nr:DNA mismatch repair endonuclease MutL [Halobellus sp. Atlit-38R]RLM90747.1 DNA mismatch repair endonuclease MutL [Halobellus sp. Atlit-38R]